MRRFLSFILGTLALSCLLAGTALWYVNRKVADGADGFLRKYVFTEPQKANFGRVSLNLLTGQFALENVTAKGRGSSSMTWTLTGREIRARLPVQQVLSGEGSVRTLSVREPVIALAFAAEEDPAGLGGLPALPRWMKKLPVESIQVSDGKIRVRNAGVAEPFEVGAVEARMVRESGEAGKGLARWEAEGKILTAPGSILIRMDIFPSSPRRNFEGEVRLKDFSLPYAAAHLFPPDPDVQIQEGLLDLRTQLTCKDDWLTASHLVEIKNLKVAVSERTKTLAGLPVKRLKDVLDIEYVSFVVPMNGSVSDPHIGIASSVEQILLKILEGKIEDKDERDRFAQRAGIYIGNKIDRALKER